MSTPLGDIWPPDVKREDFFEAAKDDVILHSTIETFFHRKLATFEQCLIWIVLVLLKENLKLKSEKLQWKMANPKTVIIGKNDD